MKLFALVFCLILSQGISSRALAQTAADPVASPDAAAAAPPAAPATSAPVAPAEAAAAPSDAPPNPMANLPVQKVWIRSDEHGNRFLKVGRDIVPVDQLAEILRSDRDPEVQKRLRSYSLWSKVSVGATVLTIGAGAGAFIGWSSSVANHESASGATPLLFLLAIASGGLQVLSDYNAEQALYRAQAIHNDRILKREPVPTPGSGPGNAATGAPQAFMANPSGPSLSMEIHF